ncbi:MAG TPA: phage holin family protein [Mycobacteriales bacterium]|nr:phage holin family protein [Mycobacteriales bacterium]
MSTDHDAPPIEERSIGELVATASRDMSLLVHQEMELAKAELTAAAKRVGIAAGLFGAAGGLGLFALVFLSVAAAFGISALGVSLGYGFVCVGGAYGVLAGLLAITGATKAVRVGKPERTIRTVQDSLAWARHPTVAPDPDAHELAELRARHTD